MAVFRPPVDFLPPPPSGAGLCSVFCRDGRLRVPRPQSPQGALGQPRAVQGPFSWWECVLCSSDPRSARVPRGQGHPDHGTVVAGGSMAAACGVPVRPRRPAGSRCASPAARGGPGVRPRRPAGVLVRPLSRSQRAVWVSALGRWQRPPRRLTQGPLSADVPAGAAPASSLRRACECPPPWPRCCTSRSPTSATPCWAA